MADILQPGAVVADLRGRDARLVLEELCALVVPHAGVAVPDLVETLLRREALASTALGDGVAVPHERHPNVPRLIGSFGRSKQGVDFGAPDGRPVHFFFVLLMPQDAGGADLKALARISNVLSAPALRSAILAAPDADEIYRLLTGQEAKAGSAT